MYEYMVDGYFSDIFMTSVTLYLNCLSGCCLPNHIQDYYCECMCCYGSIYQRDITIHMYKGTYFKIKVLHNDIRVQRNNVIFAYKYLPVCELTSDKILSDGISRSLCACVCSCAI